MNPDVGETIKTISITAAAMSPFAKLIVDVVRQSAPKLPSLSYALLAFLLGILFVEGTLYVSLVAFTLQVAVLGFMGGLVTGGLAVSMTELHKVAQTKRDAYKHEQDVASNGT